MRLVVLPDCIFGLHFSCNQSDIYCVVPELQVNHLAYAVLRGN